MSYRWAWGRVQNAQEGLGIPLVTRRDKGTCGRAIVLTEEALALIAWFEQSGNAIRQALTEAEAAMPDILKNSAPPAPEKQSVEKRPSDKRRTGSPRKKTAARPKKTPEAQ